MKRKFYYRIIILLVTSMLIFGCKKGKEETPGIKIEETTTPVIIEPIESRNLESYIEVTGKLEGKTDITMFSETSGKIIAIDKKLGDWIDKGQEIGRIDNDDYKITLDQAKASLLAAEASFENAQLQMTTSESLYEKENISKSEYITAKSAYKNAQAGLDGAKANVERAQKAYDNSRFVAPVSGYIANLPIRVGESINMGQIVCGIVNSKQLIIKTGVGESEIVNLKRGLGVSIEYSATGKRYDGKITGLGIKPLPNSASYPIEIELNNPNKELLPGMVVTCRILNKIYNDVFYTSANNVLKQYDQCYVYVIDEEDRARKRKVKLGEQADRYYVIEQGLAKGERLVVEGADNLSEGSLVEIRKINQNDAICSEEK